MRTRTRNTIEESLPSCTNLAFTSLTQKCDGTVLTESGNASMPGGSVKSTQEYMQDALGKKEPHSVIHNKQTRELYPWGVSMFPRMVGPYGSTNFGTLHSYVQVASASYLDQRIGNWSANSLPVSDPPGWTIVKPDLDDSAIVRKLLERARSLSADVLLDVVQANQAWPSLKSLITCAPEMARNWKKLRSVIKTASNTYLAWKFGVSPILSDFAAIARFAPDMKRQFDIHRQGKNCCYSSVFPMNATFYLAGEDESANGVLARRASFQGFSLENPVIRYVLVVKPVATPYMTSAFADVDALFSRFSTSPARLAWEIIPWSFVSDWFIDVRGALDRLDKALGFEPYSVVSLTKSVKWFVRSEAFNEFWATCPGHSPLYSGRVAGSEFSHYERSVLPGSNMLSWKPRFGKNQAGVSAALIAQKVVARR